MSEISDAKEFLDTIQNAPKTKVSAAAHGLKVAESAPSESPKEDVPPGRVCQYAHYRGGYAATSSTVSQLPPGAYEIASDSKTVFVVPALTPSGVVFDLPEMRSNDVIKVVETFWDSEKDYKEGNEFVVGGARYSTGIMLFGPPGSGKSCTIQMVCDKLIKMGGTVFYASCHPKSVMAWLSDFARIERNRKSIVILEDVDSLIESYGEADYLAMLSSTLTIDNVLFIATTNYPEKLDPRIYNRPGRFSHVIKIGLPSPAAREAYLKAILKNHRDVNEIVEKTEGFTIDHLNALVNAVYREKKELISEIERLRLLWKVPKVNDKPIGIGI